MKIGENQFLITKEDASGIEFSFERKFGEYRVLLGHGSRIAEVSLGEDELILIGYITDAESGSGDENDILIRILSGLESDGANIVQLCSKLGGRFVIAARKNGSVIVLNDCCGMKQAFYDTYDLDNGGITLASQARYIADIKKYSVDEYAADYYEKAKKSSEFSFPLDATLFRKIKRLLPNHFLKSDSGALRFPVLFPETRDYDEKSATGRLTSLLKNNVRALVCNFKSFFSLTGGLDSRLSLVTASEYKDDIQAVTMKYIGMPDDFYDITIPKEFCEKFGYKHEILKCEEPDDGFVSEYDNHSEHAHFYWMQMCYAIRRYGYSDKILVKGSCNEIVQFANGKLPDKDIDTELLCILFDLPKTDFSKNILSAWIESSRDYAKSSNIPLLSLFYWEHRMGSWLAECLNEGDIASEVFSPFNLREYFAVLSNLPASCRIPPNFDIFVEIMEKCEPSSSDIPLNPGRYSSLSSIINSVIKYKIPFLYKTLIKSRRKN